MITCKYSTVDRVYRGSRETRWEVFEAARYRLASCGRKRLVLVRDIG